MTFRRSAGQYLLWAVLRSFLTRSVGQPCWPAAAAFSVLVRLPKPKCGGSGRNVKDTAQVEAPDQPQLKGAASPPPTKGEPTPVSDDLKLQLATRGGFR